MSWRSYSLVWVLVVTAALLKVAPASAQDEDFDLLLSGIRDAGTVTDVDAQSFQVYRIPISFPIRNLEKHPWGLRVTFPVSLGSYRIEALTDVGDFVVGLESISIIPGVEALLPVGSHWVLKPFGEVGFGSSTSEGGTEVLWGAGIRSRGDYDPGRFRVTLGGAAMYKQPSNTRATFDSYSKIEVGADAQLPLGFSMGSKRALGGVFGMYRQYFNLDVQRVGQEPIKLEHQYEVGISFSTDPVIRLWKIKLPWIALSYRFGDVFTGVRLYFSFPF
jgi:hypothetical protein